LHYSEPQARLAEQLCARSFADQVFLCNSGAEANEAAIKLARRHGAAQADARFEIITALGSFHGRTLATIAATGQEKVREGFQPVTEGFRYVPYGDIEALRAAVGAATVAVMLEPILGEGGVLPPPAGYLEAVRQLCDERGLLLIFDEVQTGVGRTGTLFAYEQSGVSPDVMTLAKGLGTGVPIGAMVATRAAGANFGPGAHGSTFGGNPLACAVALTVLDLIGEPAFLAEVRSRGAQMCERLEAIGARHGRIQTVRGAGLLVGATLDGPGQPVVDACREAGLLVNCTATSVLRFAPPLVVSADEIDRITAIVEQVLSQ
jgi:acetylornithine aminotransferase